MALTELPQPTMARELALFEVAADERSRVQVIEVAAVFRARVLAVDDESITIEAAGSPQEIDALEELLSDFGLIASTRTGPLTLGHGLRFPRNPRD